MYYVMIAYINITNSADPGQVLIMNKNHIAFGHPL